MMEEYNKKKLTKSTRSTNNSTIVHFMEACVAEWLTPQMPDLEV